MSRVSDQFRLYGGTHPYRDDRSPYYVPPGRTRSGAADRDDIKAKISRILEIDIQDISHRSLYGAPVSNPISAIGNLNSAITNRLAAYSDLGIISNYRIRDGYNGVRVTIQLNDSTQIEIGISVPQLDSPRNYIAPSSSREFDHEFVQEYYVRPRAPVLMLEEDDSDIK